MTLRTVESTERGLVLGNCRVDRVCLSIRVREVVSVGVYKMLLSRLESLRLDFTKSGVDRARFIIKVLEVFVVGVSIQECADKINF